MVKPMTAAMFAFAAVLAAACATNIVTSDTDGLTHYENELIRKESDFSFDQTVANLEAALTARNITLMSKIDHAANAAKVDKFLRPTMLLIFGNPAIGTDLINLSQSFGIDLPMKALVFEDADGNVWVEYNNMSVLAERHGVASQNEIITRIAGALDAITTGATTARD